MLREVAREDTDLGHLVREEQAAGQLVSDEILAEVVSKRTRRDDCLGGYILDGFPRTLPQARLLERIAIDQGHRIVVIHVSVPAELLYERLAGRLTCTTCGAIYNSNSKPSKVEGFCDLDGSPLFTRSDDNEEAIAHRLALYEEKTRPLLDYYAETARLRTVEGTGKAEQVQSRIASIVTAEGGAGEGGTSASTDDLYSSYDH